MAFQITSPFNHRTLLLPHALVLHVNPSSFEESFSNQVERIQTRGGFVEQHWGSPLSEISASASTGAFMNIFTGLTSVLRQRTIAWDKYRDLLELYLNNGSVYDPQGNVVLQGSVLLMYDRGNYLGTFRTFEMEETEDAPFAFKLNWTFKVETTLLAMSPQTGRVPTPPIFQFRNQLQGSADGLGAQALSDRQDAFAIQVERDG